MNTSKASPPVAPLVAGDAERTSFMTVGVSITLSFGTWKGPLKAVKRFEKRAS
ncbi:hypothetical protein [Halorubrum salsamenti]|uniref:hypothetical protein n=1 Tax=Halorubrum salsamenti TaxID=2583990 RepID=UPI001642B436|nr:hypothetical protein [Halorubrum salsamenti]